MGLSIRAIARRLELAATTVRNELCRGKMEDGSYNAIRGQEVYASNRKSCHRGFKVAKCVEFVAWEGKI